MPDQPLLDDSRAIPVPIDTAFVRQHMINFNKDVAGVSAEFKVGVRSLPYLADHGFHDLVVLPGSFYVELALCVHVDLLQQVAGLIRNVEFHHPVMLSNEDITIKVMAVARCAERIEYAFYEAGTKSSDGEGRRPACASLKIESRCSTSQTHRFGGCSIKDFTEHAAAFINQDEFYRTLRANGNQYGPQFQGVRCIWQSGPEAIGKLVVPAGSAGAGQPHLHPVRLDCATQLFSSFFLERGGAFILQGIEELTFGPAAFAEGIWVRGRRRSEDAANQTGRMGDLEVLNETGACCLELQGVRWTHFDRIDPAASIGTPRTDIVIASSFTAEPIEDSLRFWGDFMGCPVQVGFAHYNQVFQQLLSPNSQFHHNPDGFNVILLNLEDWGTGGHCPASERPQGLTVTDPGGLKRCRLPNGLEVAHLKRHETDYLYREIFEDRSYLRHGIRLPNDATVIDIGANIGLFSLFVQNCRPQATVFAFEPNPIAYRALKANCEAQGPRLHPFNAGVSDHPGIAQLTFYEESSVFSGFHPDEEEDRRAIETVITNMVRGEIGGAADSMDEDIQQLMMGRLTRQTFECRMVSVSDIIRENGLTCVDLLKVDAEKCELEILRGIEDVHWPLIGQVVVEVHDRTRHALAVVEEILVQRGFQCAVEEEKLLAGSGLFNVYATRPGASPANEANDSLPPPSGDGLQVNVDEFVQVLDSFTQTVNTPVIVCVCPSKVSSNRDARFVRKLPEMEHRLLQRVREFSNVHAIGSEEIRRRYPSAEYHDPHGHELGHISYTPEGFAAIGSSVFRVLSGLRRLPYKVIALDCDNTLWQGVCGEEEPSGVAVPPAFRALQEFMIQQMRAGMLLCLCSRNNESDVWPVFEQRADLALKRDHFAAWRINWEPKSANLRALAGELHVGLDSFIFLDDSPVECAEVRANCPEVLVLQLPASPDRFGQFLEHVWAFDHLRITDEDLQRTQMVRENSQRERYREQAPSLKEFIDGLQLQVSISEPDASLFNRISQLTLRTNQFNFTTLRRSEKELIHYLERAENRCLAVHVSDRFGDYGLVGVLLYSLADDLCRVDTLLLSCRVLGRGVEHRILSEMGHRAIANGKTWVELPFRPTDKNQPAWEFIQPLGAGFERQTEGGVVFRFPAETLVRLRYEPGAAQSNRPPDVENRFNAAPARRRVSVAGQTELSRKLERIAVDLGDTRRICAAIETVRTRKGCFPKGSANAALSATLEGRLLGIWRKTLGNPCLGVNDNFFDVGGTSLKAVLTVSAIRRELNVNLLLASLFECPTVRLLCGKLDPGKDSGEAANEAMARGSRRIQRVRRRASAGLSRRDN